MVIFYNLLYFPSGISKEAKRSGNNDRLQHLQREKTTRGAISKLQSQKVKLDKKIEKTTQKENAIKQALTQRLMPNDETINALNNAKSIGVFDTFDEAKKALMSDD